MSTGKPVEVPIFSKAPFANYDLIVYLGGGLFALLMGYRYVAAPFGIFDLDSVSAWSTGSTMHQIIYGLTLAVICYVTGHLIAYLASHFIEGFVNKTCGSFSNLVVMSTAERAEFYEELQSELSHNSKRNFSFRKNAFVWAVHAPVAPWYALVRAGNYFETMDTRLPKRMINSLDLKLGRYFDDVSTSDKRQWFRWVEYFTYYNAPVASASMYNYLMISGFMRSVAMLMLLGLWAEIFHLVIAYFDQFHIHQENGLLGWAAYMAAFYLAYICSLTAYVKFYRRYIEEAIMGFLLEIPSDPAHGGCGAQTPP